MKVVELSWTEISQHRVTVIIDDDLTVDQLIDGYDLADAVANLDDDGFIGVERDDMTAEFVDVKGDPDRAGVYEHLDLTGYNYYGKGGHHGQQSDPGRSAQMG